MRAMTFLCFLTLLTACAVPRPTTGEQRVPPATPTEDLAQPTAAPRLPPPPMSQATAMQGASRPPVTQAMLTLEHFVAAYDRHDLPGTVALLAKQVRYGDCDYRQWRYHRFIGRAEVEVWL